MRKGGGRKKKKARAGTYRLFDTAAKVKGTMYCTAAGFCRAKAQKDCDPELERPPLGGRCSFVILAVFGRSFSDKSLATDVVEALAEFE